MRSCTTRREWLALLGIGATGLTGCLGDGEGVPEHYEQNEYVSASGSDAETLVHHQISDQTSSNMVRLTLDGAYAVTTDMEVFPMWMDINRVDDDGRVYEAELREGLEWSDPYGEMTAEDWVYFIRNIHQGEDNWAASEAVGDWAGIDVEQTGRLTFEMELPQPNVDFPFEPVLWAAECYPKELIEPYVEDRDEEGLRTDDEINELAYTGNLGAYTLERWDRDAEFVVTRNDDYYVRDLDDVPDEWADAPRFDRYRVRIVPEESSRIEALRAQEVTTSGVPPDRVSEFRDEDHVYVNEVPQPFLAVLAYNQRRNGWEPFRDRTVRQALSTAIDKVEIAENVHRGFAEVAQTFQPEWSDWFVDEEVRRFGEGDTQSYEEARSMLEDVASDHGFEYDGDELVDENGDQVTLELVYSDTAETTETTVQLMAQDLAEVGIDVDLNGMQGDLVLSRYFQNDWVGEGEPPWDAGPNNAGPRDRTESDRDWDMIYGISFNTYPRTPSSTESFWTERGTANAYGYVPDEDLQAMFDEARRATDEERRREIYGEIFGIISEDQPVNFVIMNDDLVGYQEYVEGPREEFGHGWNSLQTWNFREI